MPKLIQIRMSDESFGQLETLKKTSGIATTTDVIKTALSLFKWVIEQQKSGYEIYAKPKSATRKEDSGGKVQFLMPL